MAGLGATGDRNTRTGYVDDPGEPRRRGLGEPDHQRVAHMSGGRILVGDIDLGHRSSFAMSSRVRGECDGASGICKVVVGGVDEDLGVLFCEVLAGGQAGVDDAMPAGGPR